MFKLSVFVGSLRKESINLKLAKALAKLAQEKFEFKFVELTDLPIYNEDLWENPPISISRIKNDIETADAILFVTPEYNRSIPPVLKNVIDWGTRPWGKNSWNNKPVAIVGTTPGSVGTASAQADLRSILVILGMIVMGQPEVYFVYKPELIDADYNITDPKTAEFLQKFIDNFATWVENKVKKTGLLRSS